MRCPTFALALLRTFADVLVSALPRYQDGRPVYIEQLGKLDLTKLYTMTTPERQMQSLVVEYEKFQRDRLPICSELSGHLIETSCTIMDLKGVGLSQFWKVKGYVQEASGSESFAFSTSL